MSTGGGADPTEPIAHGTAISTAPEDPLAGVPAEPGAPKPDPILVVDQVVRRFGGLVAVDVHHLEIQRGAITAIIGPNGAGKTTLFNLLTGFDKPQAGSWTFAGHPAHGRRAHQLANLGMVRTFQLTKALSRLTVIDNMRLGATGQSGENFWLSLFPFLWRDQEQEVTARAEELLARFQLDRMRDEYAGSLSGGQRKLLEMARALMVKPQLVMLDEPMAGVNPALVQSLLTHVKQLREEGMSVLFVEHDMDMVQEISDWVVVMGEGKVIAEGTADQVMADQRVIDAYLGAHHDGAVMTVAGHDVEPDQLIAQATGDPEAPATPEGSAQAEALSDPEAPAEPEALSEPDPSPDPPPDRAPGTYPEER